MAAGDKALWSDVANAINRPVCRLVQQAAQSIPSGTLTALTFGAGSEDVDSHSSHDTATNNTRITPTVAGWYDVRGSYFSAAMTTPTNRSCVIRKNGATLIAPGPRDTGATITTSKEAAALISFNGTTDYVELMAQQTSAGAVNTNVASQQTSTFECVYVRPL